MERPYRSKQPDHRLLNQISPCNQNWIKKSGIFVANHEDIHCYKCISANHHHRYNPVTYCE